MCVPDERLMLWSSYERCGKTIKEVLGYFDSQTIVLAVA